MNIPQPLTEWRASMSDEYLEARIEVRLRGDYYDRLRKTGITPPGYPIRAVYVHKTNGNYYVYEGGLFWESAEWRQFYRDHGKTPSEANHNPATAPDEG